MLAQIRDCLRERGPLSAAEIAHRIDADLNQVKSALDVWAANGKVTKVVPSCGGSCNSCGASQVETFMWAADKPADEAAPVSCSPQQPSRRRFWARSS